MLAYERAVKSHVSEADLYKLEEVGVSRECRKNNRKKLLQVQTGLNLLTEVGCHFPLTTKYTKQTHQPYINLIRPPRAQNNPRSNQDLESYSETNTIWFKSEDLISPFGRYQVYKLFNKTEWYSHITPDK